jgi:hypothetical protein
VVSVAVRFLALAALVVREGVFAAVFLAVVAGMVKSLQMGLSRFRTASVIGGQRLSANDVPMPPPRQQNAHPTKKRTEPPLFCRPKVPAGLMLLP